jgi:hypothetical protein
MLIGFAGMALSHLFTLLVYNGPLPLYCLLLASIMSGVAGGSGLAMAQLTVGFFHYMKNVFISSGIHHRRTTGSPTAHV